MQSANTPSGFRPGHIFAVDFKVKSATSPWASSEPKISLQNYLISHHISPPLHLVEGGRVEGMSSHSFSDFGWGQLNQETPSASTLFTAVLNEENEPALRGKFESRFSFNNEQISLLRLGQYRREVVSPLSWRYHPPIGFWGLDVITVTHSKKSTGESVQQYTYGLPLAAASIGAACSSPASLAPSTSAQPCTSQPTQVVNEEVVASQTPVSQFVSKQESYCGLKSGFLNKK